MNIKFWSAIFVIVLSTPAAVPANWGGTAGDGSFGSGNFEALGATQVELVNEDLRIDLYKDHAAVTVEYLFRNTGSDVLVRAGFPDILFSKRNQIEDYRIEVDGAALAHKHIIGKEITSIPLPDNAAEMNEESGDGKLRMSWFVSEVPFKQSEEKKVKITCRSPYQMSFGGFSDDSDYDPETFRYLISTGATWKGPIQRGTITITVNSGDPDRITVQPAGRFKRAGNVITWTFENYEPLWADNILVNLNNPVSVKSAHYNPAEEFHASWYSFEGNKYFAVIQTYGVNASSTLRPVETYNADKAKDWERGTAWVEGKEGDGVGEYLVLKLKKPAPITQIGLIPGYAKSRDAYFNNNRVAQMTAVINGDYKVTSTIPDEFTSYNLQHPKAYHFIDISGYGKPVNTIKLIIDKVHPGAKFQDTCISEIILRQQLKAKPEHAGAR